MTAAGLGARARRLEWPLLVFLLALLPRLAGLGARPFWLDEVFTLQRASLMPAALVLNSFENHHMPSFFLMLRPLVGLGHPEFWLRLPSAIFGALAVMLVFLIARQIAGRLAGVLAALIIGLSPTFLSFSQEARSYTLVMVLILVGLYGLVRLVQTLPAACQPMTSPAARTGWACFILGTLASIDVLADGLTWLLATNIAAIIIVARGRGLGGFMRNMLKADALILLLAAPFYVLLELHQNHSFVKSLGWIPPLDGARVWYSLGSVYLMHLADSVSYRMLAPSGAVLAWVIDIALVFALIAAVRRLRQTPATLTALAVSVLFLPLAFIIISLWQPILLPRYILWSAAPFAILAGIGSAVLLENLARRARIFAMAAITALLLANMLPYYKAETKPRWDIAAQLLAQDLAPGDILYLHDYYATKLLETYLPAGKKALVRAPGTTSLKHAAHAVDQGKRVWAVYGLAGQGSDKIENRDYHKDQKLFGSPLTVQQAGSHILIAEYGPTGQ